VGNVTLDQNGEADLPLPGTLPAASGFIRIQTHGNSPAGQPESSQYSRVLAYAGLGGCAKPEMEIRVRAWRDVPAGATDHDQVQVRGTEIVAGGAVDAGAELWFTYTVTNTGLAELSDVTVKDSFDDPVCVLVGPIAPQGQAGCAKPYAVP
jgi:hypothetical protein